MPFLFSAAVWCVPSSVPLVFSINYKSKKPPTRGLQGREARLGGALCLRTAAEVRPRAQAVGRAEAAKRRRHRVGGAAAQPRAGGAPFRPKEGAAPLGGPSSHLRRYLGQAAAALTEGFAASTARMRRWRENIEGGASPAPCPTAPPPQPPGRSTRHSTRTEPPSPATALPTLPTLAARCYKL